MSQSESSPVSEQMRNGLNDLHRDLLNLHKTLVDAERSAYEDENGRVTNNEMLGLLFNHDRFAWLRVFSKLIVSMDDLTNIRRPAPASNVPPMLNEVRRVLEADEIEGEADFSSRFKQSLENNEATAKARQEALSTLKWCESIAAE